MTIASGAWIIICVWLAILALPGLLAPWMATYSKTIGGTKTSSNNCGRSSKYCKVAKAIRGVALTTTFIV